MKSLVTVLLLLGLAACSSDEKVAEPVAAPAQEEAAVEDTEAAPAAAQEELADEQRPQTVEESGGEPDPSDAEDKPIILAQAATPATNQNWKFTEGEHYVDLPVFFTEVSKGLDLKLYILICRTVKGLLESLKVEIYC